MYTKCFVALLILSGITSCNSKQANNPVITQRFIHKYGYDVSREEWENERYPGQIITTLQNGITMVAAYEEGDLHGITTYTHPYSNTIASQNYYDRGNLIKKISYDIRGLPLQEELFLSPQHYKITSWYTQGVPKCIEEYIQDRLSEGQYFSMNNELEAKIHLGTGEKICRNAQGKLLAKETYEQGNLLSITTYHVNGTPHIITPYKMSAVHGERKTFAATGEPIAIENFYSDQLHGVSTYFQNGVKYVDINFSHGQRHGMERRFIDGDILVQQIKWEHDRKHGPSTVYSDGFARTDWYFNDKIVAKERFDTLTEQDRLLITMTERANKNRLNSPNVSPSKVR